MVYVYKKESGLKRFNKFVAKANLLHNNKYIYEIIEPFYKNPKVICICKNCGRKFIQTVANHYRYTGCICEKNLIKQKNFIKKAILIHNNKYDYSEVKYKTADTPVKIYCKQCGIFFEQTPDSHLDGCGCHICNKHELYNTEKFIQKAKQIHKNKFDYSQVNYINMRTKIKIRCKKCNRIFEQTPALHLHSKHCPICFGTYQYTENEIIQKAKQIHGDKYEYLNIENYKNKYSYLLIRCKKCNKIFKQRISSHFAGSGCIYCKQSKGEKFIENWLINNKIEYESQKRFKDCKNKNPLPFDFYLPKLNTCIEYQGEHHYESNRYFKHDTLEYRQKNDQIKRNYCNKNNLKLIEIKYNDNIEKKLKEELNNECI